MAVIKANAYGHGAIQVASTAAKAGAEWLAVARIEEALSLRDEGIVTPVLVLGYTHPYFVPQAIIRDISLTVFDKDTINAYLKQANRMGKALKIHVKIETGMGRLGLFPDEGYPFIQWLKEQQWINLEGVFTHFARADEPDCPVTGQQIEKFTTFIKQLEKGKLRPQWVHACNSAGILNFPQAHFDMVRPGISMYGLNPSKQTRVPSDFQPALVWKSRLVSLKEFPPGHGISYSHLYTTQNDERIGAISVGYADNFRRQDGNIALVGGKRVKVVGRVCMDQCMVQLDCVTDPQVGDEVILIGKQGQETITADDVADIWHTANYEVVANLASRLPRLYLNP